MLNKNINNIINNAYVFSVIAKIISILTGIIYSILFSRYLGSSLRGEASIINNYSTIISLLMCLGIYQAYPYFKKTKNKNIYQEFINYVFGLFFLTLVIDILIIILFKPNFNYITILILAPMMMTIKQLNYVVLIENPKVRNMANIKLDIFDIVFILIMFIITEANYKLCIAILFVKQVVFLVIAILNLNVNIFKIKPSLKGIFPYIKYGIVPMITVILMEVNYKVDVIMLEKFKISVSEIGIYSIGVMLAEKLWLVPDALKDILLSKLARGKTEKEVVRISRVSFFIMVLLVILMLLFGKQLILLMYGNEYGSAYRVTIIILSGTLGMIFYKMIYSYNVANGHKNVNLLLLSVAAIINIIINYILIPIFGTYGAAVASLISYTLCGISFLIYFCVKTKTNIFDMILIKKDDFQLLRNLIKK